MMGIDLDVFKHNIEATRIALREAILSINIWSPSTGLIIAEWQGNPTSVALLTQLISELEDTLRDANMPKIKDYIYMELDNNQELVVIDHGNDLMQGWLVDASKVSPGILLGMAVPNAITNIAAARK